METTKEGASSSAAPSASSTGGKTAIELFNDRVKRSAGATALRWKQGGAWREARWGDWDQASRKIAAGLTALGVGVGDRVCLLGNSRPEWVHCDIGVLMAGGIAVPIYQSNVPHECEYIINDSGAKVVMAENPLQLEK